MTEAVWLTTNNPDIMFASLKGKTSDRKRRLLCCQFCLSIWEWLEPRAKVAVEAAERFADDPCSEASMSEAYHILVAPSDDFVPLGTPPERTPQAEGFTAAVHTSRPPEEGVDVVSARKASACVAWATSYTVPVDMQDVVRDAKEAEHTTLIRCVFGNPFRPVIFSPSWLNETVVALAHGIYANRAFDRLPILADALQEAGCEDEQVLTHCRSNGPHARGCWVVDVVLGKR